MWAQGRFHLEGTSSLGWTLGMHQPLPTCRILNIFEVQGGAPATGHPQNPQVDRMPLPKGQATSLVPRLGEKLSPCA